MTGWLDPPPAGALHGTRVLDLSRVLAGPFATMLLGDLGADVLKVERPGSGDDTRAWGPPWLDAPGARVSAYYLSCNRNKRSIAVDLARDEGRAAVTALAATADVVVENFRPGTLARMGLDHVTLSRANPRLITCSITGFGPGPLSGRPGYDAMIQAMSGLMSITGEAAGPPVKVGVAMVDVLTGLFAATAITAALASRAATGLGQRIEVSLFDAALAALVNQASNWLIAGVEPGRAGNEHPSIAPYQTYDTADHPVFLAVGNDEQFRRACGLVGLERLATDSRFATNAARTEHRGQLNALLAPVLATRPAAAWLAEFDAADIPAGPVNTIPEAFALVQPWVVEHPVLGPVATPANPIRMSATPPSVRLAPPLLGEHD